MALRNRKIFKCKQGFTMTNNMGSSGLWDYYDFLQAQTSFHHDKQYFPQNWLSHVVCHGERLSALEKFSVI